VNDRELFLNTYKQAAADIGREITESTQRLTKSFQSNDPLYQEVRKFITTGGKRFRPALSLVTARSFGHSDIAPHLALETFHKYLLAHDDIIDRDDIRYGAPTLHAKMTQTYSHSPDSKHVGTSLAIIGGDLLEAMTHKIILSSHLPSDTKIGLEMLIVQAVEEVSWGWYDQFLMDYLPLDSQELSFERIENSIIWVTGKYSIKLPLLFGYAVAGQQSPEGLERLSDKLGALYQTGDDLIGLFGDEASTGKSNVGDILQGKKTLPIWLTYQNASAGDKITLAHILGNKQASLTDIEEVRHIIRQSGGMDHTKGLMHTYAQDCLSLIKEMGLSPKLQQFLRGFVAFIEKRDR
jgi:geranylgeranyl pyrophosphate synthase